MHRNGTLSATAWDEPRRSEQTAAVSPDQPQRVRISARFGDVNRLRWVLRTQAPSENG